MAAESLFPFRATDHGGTITHVVFDYGSTLTSSSDPIDVSLGMRPVSPAAEEAIWKTHETGVVLALLSNTKPGQDRRPALEAAGVDALFGDRVFLSHELGLAKPSPAVYEHVLAELDVRPVQLLMCGNNLDHDVAPAVAQGIRAALVGWPPRRLPLGSTYVLSIAELPALLTGAQPHG
ncbi:HAD family hydrolase [Actinomadura sp. WMMB 499]|uniref:HAD family hydrolase n=1 Tax=Actinomadura sp. WMMB 499 TaxID=1219491 RepID=UPI0020C7C4A6|nr:HAD family hydrolase [Actinomadura sp. WMMB 499]